MVKEGKNLKDYLIVKILYPWTYSTAARKASDITRTATGRRKRKGVASGKIATSSRTTCPDCNSSKCWGWWSVMTDVKCEWDRETQCFEEWSLCDFNFFALRYETWFLMNG